MIFDMTYEQAIEKADALKQLGTSEIYLSAGDMPWEIADTCRPGSSHRLEIDTGVQFSGKDEKTGLSFRWSFDIEPRSANGKGSYEIDAAGCRAVLAKLQGKARHQFLAYLDDCATKVQAKAMEWRAIADRQAYDANVLRELSSEAQRQVDLTFGA